MARRSDSSGGKIAFGIGLVTCVIVGVVVGVILGRDSGDADSGISQRVAALALDTRGLSDEALALSSAIEGAVEREDLESEAETLRARLALIEERVVRVRERARWGAISPPQAEQVADRAERRRARGGLTEVRSALAILDREVVGGLDTVLASPSTTTAASALAHATDVAERQVARMASLSRDLSGSEPEDGSDGVDGEPVEEGRILAADGTVIAESVPVGEGSPGVRAYPEDTLYGHPIGYSFAGRGDTEFERYHRDELFGEGHDLVTSIVPSAQRAALAALERQGSGALVAIEPSTGAVKAMASSEPYDPNGVPHGLPSLRRDKRRAPLVDRATQRRYPPGSTFEVVVAAAGLQSGAITPETAIAAPGSIVDDEGHVLTNDFEEDFGPIALGTALTDSVDTWFGQLGQRVGRGALLGTMEEFGFGSPPPIDLPRESLSVSGFGEDGALDRSDGVDPALASVGRAGLRATPLQIAMVAAAVADEGRLMAPRIWDRVVDGDGRTVERLDPSEYGRPLTVAHAEELTVAMEGAVDEGVGADAAIPGVPVAAKAGTAKAPASLACDGEGESQAWFMGFVPADEPEIAIAATVECTDGSGSEVAASIFRDVAEAILTESPDE